MTEARLGGRHRGGGHRADLRAWLHDMGIHERARFESPGTVTVFLAFLLSGSAASMKLLWSQATGLDECRWIAMFEVELTSKGGDSLRHGRDAGLRASI